MRMRKSCDKVVEYTANQATKLGLMFLLKDTTQ